MLRIHTAFLTLRPARSCILSSLVPLSLFFKPLHTIMTTLHSVTRRIQGLIHSNASQCGLCAVVCEMCCHHLVWVFFGFYYTDMHNCSHFIYVEK